MGMAGTVTVEVVGLKNSECSPFPCDDDRTCGLEECFKSGKLVAAFQALTNALNAAYGDRVETKLTLLDEGTPQYIKEIIEREHPPIPMILVNGKVTKIGRIVLDRTKAEIEKALV